MEYIKGFDVSTLPEVEQCGGRFYDGGPAEDALEILRRHGGNYVRLRLWNDPYDEHGNDYGAGVCDLPTVLALGARAKKMGMKWLLDFHYSDFWADPGKQWPPKAWQGLDPDGLESAVYAYTKAVARQCLAADLAPDMVQVGNEITNGLLWPWGKAPNWDIICRFVMAGVRAVREVLPETLVMVHLDNGGNNGLYRTWFDNFFSRGGDCDVIGLSYYPFWHGTMDALQANMNDIAVRYGKDLVVVETSMGFTLDSYAWYEQLSDDERKGGAAKLALALGLKWPMSPEGQADFMADLLAVIEGVPDGKGRGFFWWEPTWIPVPGSGWAKRAGWEYVKELGPGGNEWANQALFDFGGNALPALRVIRQYQEASQWNE